MDQQILSAIERWIDEHAEEYIADVQALSRIPSVSRADKAQPGAPFGPDCRKALDAAEQGIHLVETDPTVDSVGRGGYLNADGELALDGAVMDGDTLKTGAVACVRGYEHPVSIARAVMEKHISRSMENILSRYEA